MDLAALPVPVSSMILAVFVDELAKSRPRHYVGFRPDGRYPNAAPRGRLFQFGVNLGADFPISGGFGISTDLNWGLTGLLKSSFKTVDRPLYPIYATLGVFYSF